MLGAGFPMEIRLLRPFLAVSEHRLVPACVRGEWPAMRRRVRSVWPPASQEGSHAGYAGVGVVSLTGPRWPFLPLPRLFFAGFSIQVA